VTRSTFSSLNKQAILLFNEVLEINSLSYQQINPPRFHTLRHIPTHPDTSRHISSRNLQTIQTPNQKSNPKRLEQKMQNECCCSSKDTHQQDINR
jgi:hypothetical protein